jgi:hypothetical protein
MSKDLLDQMRHNIEEMKEDARTYRRADPVHLDIARRMGIASRRVREGIVEDALRDALRRSETIAPPPDIYISMAALEELVSSGTVTPRFVMIPPAWVKP